MENSLVAVQKFGQSICYDNIRRSLITSGELHGMVDHGGLLGVTSNPAIFEKALAGSTDYDQALKALVAQGVGTAQDIYERLATEDIQLAADILFPVYVRTHGRDGFVSFEVSPYLAHDTQGTLDEARRLRAMIGRDNVMIKVPATPAGVPAITQLISKGVNVNVTLLFAVETYEAAASAYMTGLEPLVAKGSNVDQVGSVASFFISRIDSLVDQKLSQALDATRDAERRTQLKKLVGKVAIANAKIAHARYRDLYAGEQWKALAARGAKPQRLLWASTSTKNPKYSKTIYVDELIGPETVNTMPVETSREFRAAGRVRPSLTENENQWLGWLHVVDGQRDHSGHLQHLTEEVRDAGCKSVLLLGMGGSSLCPEVMRRTFGVVDGFPELLVLDSTVPAQVKTFARKVDLARTLCIVSSKSGGTTEPNVFKQYFLDKVQQAVGAERAGSRFIAITDPGTKLHQIAKADRFRHIVHGVPSIGGRYLQAMRHAVRDAKRVTTTLGYGPRFLHSTGQLHKGGPNTGVFLQITAGNAEDVPIPGQHYSFGILKRAQAQGDFEVLAERKRRLLRVHLGPDVRAGLAGLREIVQSVV